MRKSSFGLAMIIAALLTMVVPAFGAPLHEPHQDMTLDCAGDEIGVWHFVANQHKSDAEYLVLRFTFGPGDYEQITTEEADVEGEGEGKVTKGSAHWWVEGPASLDGIEVSSRYPDGSPLPGKLVVSDAYCVKKDR